MNVFIALAIIILIVSIITHLLMKGDRSCGGVTGLEKMRPVKNPLPKPRYKDDVVNSHLMKALDLVDSLHPKCDVDWDVCKWFHDLMRSCIEESFRLIESDKSIEEVNYYYNTTTDNIDPDQYTDENVILGKIYDQIKIYHKFYNLDKSIARKSTVVEKTKDITVEDVIRLYNKLDGESKIKFMDQVGL